MNETEIPWKIPLVDPATEPELVVKLARRFRQIMEEASEINRSAGALSVFADRFDYEYLFARECLRQMAWAAEQGYRFETKPYRDPSMPAVPLRRVLSKSLTIAPPDWKP